MGTGLFVEWTPGIEHYLNQVLLLMNTDDQAVSSIADLKRTLEASIRDKGQISDALGQERGVSFQLLKQSREWMERSGEKSNLWLHEAMKSSRYFVQPEPVLEKDPVLVKRLEKMRAQVENRLYAKMVSHVANDWVARAKQEERADMRHGLDTAKLALNLIASVISVFAAVYFVFNIAFQDTVLSISAASIGAIGIFLVETLLFVIRGSQLDARVAKDREDQFHGIQSPFPPAAPSLIEAERKRRQIEREERAEERRRKQITEKASSNPTPQQQLLLPPKETDQKETGLTNKAKKAGSGGPVMEEEEEEEETEMEEEQPFPPEKSVGSKEEQLQTSNSKLEPLLS